jgi:hypothetical protein
MFLDGVYARKTQEFLHQKDVRVQYIRCLHFCVIRVCKDQRMELQLATPLFLDFLSLLDIFYNHIETFFVPALAKSLLRGFSIVFFHGVHCQDLNSTWATCTYSI